MLVEGVLLVVVDVLVDVDVVVRVLVEVRVDVEAGVAAGLGPGAVREIVGIEIPKHVPAIAFELIFVPVPECLR
jgi:hypothetical protein